MIDRFGWVFTLHFLPYIVLVQFSDSRSHSISHTHFVYRIDYPCERETKRNAIDSHMNCISICISVKWLSHFFLLCVWWINICKFITFNQTIEPAWWLKGELFSLFKYKSVCVLMHCKITQSLNLKNQFH